MSELTGAYRKTSEQHVQLGPSRVSRDNKDLTLIKEWFDRHNPFGEDGQHLKSLSTGLIARMLDEIFKTNLVIGTWKMRASSEKKEFKHLKSSYLRRKFSRLTALANFQNNVFENFCYELTPEPTSLFKQGMMRKSTKAVLRNHLLGTENATIPTTNDVCVVDGGALLHKVHWPKSTYSEVLEQYTAFVKQRFGKYTCVSVVFDGYSDRKSTKGQEHLRRMSKASASIEITESSKVTCSREAFLANIDNKERLIKLLCTRLERERFVAVQSNGDADISIVKTAREYTETGRCVVVMAEDTDILVLMMKHSQYEINSQKLF
eukprot:gene8020-13930_t